MGILVDPAKRFETLDIIPGEAAFRAYGLTLSDLFANAALALFSVMVDLSTVEPREERIINLADQNIERLLIDFLSELVYLKDADSMLFTEFEVDVRKKDRYHLRARLRGDRINPAKHKLGADVKGVTIHMYKFEQLSDRYQAQVVLDV